MKASELRIGNFVNIDGVPTSENVKVKGIKKSKNWHGGCVVLTNKSKNSIDAIKAIPLTEEWLEKFGFSKEKNIIPMYTKNKLTIATECEMYEKGRVYFNSWAILKHKIKHVHQLQNLYFALTGEELTLK